MSNFKRYDRFDSVEVKLLKEALESDDLWPYVYGNDPRRHFIEEATKELSNYFKRPNEIETPYVVPTSSGTASIHVALAGLRVPAGTEVIVSPITDIGTVTPIIAQNLIPVFADVDPDSGNITAETISKRIKDKTGQINKRISAVIVVHLTGSPVDMEPIVNLCKPLGIKVIEDTAQGLGAKIGNQRIGTYGDAGCFSLNSQKHITSGEGGFVIVHTEDDFYRCHNFSDKHRDRFRDTRERPKGGDEHSIYRGVGMNYRLSELNGAMILGQLGKLEDIARRRHRFGTAMDAQLGAYDGIVPQKHIGTSRPSFFFYMFRVNEDLTSATKESIIKDIKSSPRLPELVRVSGSYGRPIYQYEMFREKAFCIHSPATPSDLWPAELMARQVFDDISYTVDYKNLSLSATEEYINRSFSVWFNTAHTAEHADIVSSIVVEALYDNGVNV